MANLNAAYGLRPVRHLAGGVIRMAKYPIADDYNTAIFYGDMVKLSSSGQVQVSAAGDTTNIGVFMGCFYTPDTGTDKAPKWSMYWPASTSSQDAYALVIDDPNVLFSVQATTAASTDVGANADISYTAGSTLTGVSGLQLDGGAIGTGTANLRIVGIVDSPDNAYGSYVKLLVRINEHLYTSASGV